jgi:single-strand DNA-binding protein
MSEGYCKTMMLCNVGADPELRATQNGTMVLNLRVAVNSSYLDKDKKRVERCDWFSVVCFGRRAEGLSKAITKGTTLFIEAEPRVRSYDDKAGNKRTVTEFHLLDVKFCGGGKRGAPAEDDGPPPERGGYRRPDGNSAPREAPVEPPPDDYAQGGGFGDDDVPF